VIFGTFVLPHVLEVQVKKARVEIEHFMPHRNVAYRRDQTTLGQTAIVSGEIRDPAISNVFARIEQLRHLNDGVTRLLDLEDGETVPFNAKLVDPSYALDVADWVTNDYRVPYWVTLLEVA
jgi:hypothetical protein